MPLVPPFGTYIDIFGLLMQLMVTGLSFVVLTVVVRRSSSLLSSR